MNAITIGQLSNTSAFNRFTPFNISNADFYGIKKQKKSLNLEEIAMIALTAAATFSILDTYVPVMGVTARSGAGFGIGANLVGFPGGL